MVRHALRDTLEQRTAELEALNVELQERNRRQSAVAALGQAAIAAQELDELLNQAAAVAAQTLGCDFAGILELLPEGNELLVRRGYGWGPGMVGQYRVTTRGASAAGFVLAQDGPVVVVRNVAEDVRFGVAPLLLERGVVSAMAVAIRGRERPWGTFGVHTRVARLFGPDDADFLQSMANVLALAIERHDVEAAQRREKETLQLLFDNMPVMISITDAQGRLVQVNRAWERTLGWTLEQARDVDLFQHFYPEGRQREEALRFMSGADGRWADFRIRARSGRLVDAAWFRIRQSDGSSIGFGFDITERKRVEEERQRLLESERGARAEAEAALDRVRAIHAITDTGLHRLDVDDLLKELLTRLRSVLTLDRAVLFLVDDAEKALYVRAADGLPGELVRRVRIPLGRAVSGRIAVDGNPRIVNDAESLDVAGVIGLPAPDAFEMPRATMGAPLRVGGRVFGVVTVASNTPRAFTESELTLLLLVADRVAPVLEQSRLLETVRADEERMKTLSQRLIKAQEDERRRLAVELHDELGQVLTAIKIRLESLPRRSFALAEPGALEDVIESVDHAMDRVRDLALDLRPAVLDDLGLPAALRWYVDRFARATQIRPHLAVDAVTGLDPALDTACFRVAQEALTNVARHAQARNVWLSLHRRGEDLELVVRDDGRGFDLAAARARAVGGGSVGLLGMQERVALVGGSCTVQPGAEGGTEVRALFPLGEKRRNPS